MKHQPPHLAKSILRHFCHVSFIEEVEGDLDEQFHERLTAKGSFSAKMYYWRDVLNAIRQGNRSSRNGSGSNALSIDSLRHFTRIFFRNLRHNRSSSFINIAGLALSLTSFIVIYLYVVDELTFDAFHPSSENTYRISHSFKRQSDGGLMTDARAAGMWIVGLKERVPEVIAYTRFSRFGYPGSVTYEKGNKVFEEQQFFWADSTYTSIFNLSMISGDVSALKVPHHVIINETIAAKYFGESDPMGQELTYRWDGVVINLVVAGVMKNYPSNAHFHPDFIGNNIALDPIWKRDGDDRVNNWYDAFTYSYLLLEEGANAGKVSEELTKIFRERLKDRTDIQPVLTKLTDIHFTPGMVISLEAPGDRMYPYVSASVGILILLIAGINYMNLATARSARRSKEVALRKTLGVRRSHLVGQFMGESLMLIVISFALALIITGFALPFFNQVSGKSFDISSLFRPNVLMILGLMIILLAVLSGSYPAFYLSAFRPAEMLKGKTVSGRGAESFRKVLVVFQFSITMLLVISAVIINNQISYIRSSKLAQNGQTMAVRLPGYADKNKIVFRDMVAANSNVEQVSLSNHLPHQETAGFITVPFVVSSVSNDDRWWDIITIDENFADMFNLDFIAGRNFTSANPADTNNVILNEAAIRDLGLTPEEALGREIRVNMAQFPYRGVIIGVTRDFPYRSIKKAITPAVLHNHFLEAGTLHIDFKNGVLGSTVTDIERSWNKVYPGSPLQYWFMDDEFDRMYTQEMRMGKLSDYFTVFAIVIACLGLFGLASFTAEQRTKEIGIRKVLGASMGQILLLLTNRFIALVLISYAIAIPMAFYAMNSWLDNFVYKVPLHWSVFAGAGLLILVLTYITVGIESIRAAIANPVESIRHE